MNDLLIEKEYAQQTEKPKRKRKRKKYIRPTTARFDTEECKLILMAMSYSANRDMFINEGGGAVQKAGRIIGKLKDRIERERVKKDKVVVSMMGGE